MAININLIFDEIEITPAHQAWGHFLTAGSLAKAWFTNPDNGEFDETTPGKDERLFLPDHSLVYSARDFPAVEILDQVKKYLEIFDVNVRIGYGTPLSWGFDEKYIKILPPYIRPYKLPQEKEFKNLPTKYNLLKRLLWLGDGVLQSANFRRGWAIIFADEVAVKNLLSEGYNGVTSIARDIAHEAAHLFNLEHHGDSRDPRSKTEQGSYYPNENLNIQNSYNWVPMMGSQSRGQIVQWSKGDYMYAVAPPGASVGNDFEIFYSNMLYFTKSRNGIPNTTYKWAEPKRSPYFGFRGKQPSRPYIVKNYKYIKYLIQSDHIGMIGFDQDYDIYKVLLPAGNYYASVKPHLEGSENESMLDPGIDILYCDCEEEFSDFSIDTLNKFTPIWPEEDNSYQKSIIRNKIGKENDFYANNGDDAGIEMMIGNTNTKNREREVFFANDYTTLVYIKVYGMTRGDVNPITKIPLIKDAGYSDFGSVGKYKLTLKEAVAGDAGLEGGNPVTPLNIGANPPFGVCKKIKICNDNPYLLVAPENFSFMGGNGDPNGLHFKEIEIVENGEVVYKNFLVYGQPVPENTPDEYGKFYLLINDNGVCKKQEFIVGNGGDLEERGLLK